MRMLTVSLPGRSYPVLITENNFPALCRMIKKLDLGSDAFVITQRRIAARGARLLAALRSCGIKAYVHLIPETETSKSVKEYVRAASAISKIDVKKRLFLAAFGGGVVGDLCGFAAATYKRGVPYIQIPTTLLAQVDSAIGGKTGIDLKSGKNLLGAFYQPRVVFSDTGMLKSLPPREIQSGMAEVVKYGVIYDQKLFAFLEKNAEKILRLDPRCLEHIIYASSVIKARIVEQDEREEKGLRTILNFGHTVGHALETASGYTKFTHGRAVGIGMLCAAEIALNAGMLDTRSFRRLETLMRRFRLPLKAKNVEFPAVEKAFYRDKKFIRGRIRMVLPTRIGHVIVTEDISFDSITPVIRKRISR